MPRAEWPYYTPGFPLSIPLRHGSRVAGLAGGPTDPFEPDPGGVLLADTSELAWYRPPGDKGLVTVETERSQALIGHVKANRRAVRNLAADLDNDFAALVATSLGEPLARARRILLTAGARAGNTGMQWNEARTSLTDWGKAPTRKK